MLRSLHTSFALLALLAVTACGSDDAAATADGDEHLRELHLAIELLCLAELQCSEPGRTLEDCVDFAWAVVHYSYPERCYPEVSDYTLCLRDPACDAPADGPDACDDARHIVETCANAESDNI